jgi:hypothetical protein
VDADSWLVLDNMLKSHCQQFGSQTHKSAGQQLMDLLNTPVCSGDLCCLCLRVMRCRFACQKFNLDLHFNRLVSTAVSCPVTQRPRVAELGGVLAHPILWECDKVTPHMFNHGLLSMQAYADEPPG